MWLSFNDFFFFFLSGLVFGFVLGVFCLFCLFSFLGGRLFWFVFVCFGFGLLVHTEIPAHNRVAYIVIFFKSTETQSKKN